MKMTIKEKKYVELRKAFRQYIEPLYEGIPCRSIYFAAKRGEFKTIRASNRPKARYLVKPDVLISFVERMQDR